MTRSVSSLLAATLTSRTEIDMDRVATKVTHRQVPFPVVCYVAARGLRRSFSRRLDQERDRRLFIGSAGAGARARASLVRNAESPHEAIANVEAT